MFDLTPWGGLVTGHPTLFSVFAHKQKKSAKNQHKITIIFQKKCPVIPN